MEKEKNKDKSIISLNEIRSSWLRIFKEKSYEEIESNSLIPKDDDSLLWINSGIAALKKLFNNSLSNKGRNLVNCQKVIRTDDLSNINENSYHQTLFEMLGCFSIGGNFKEEVIPIIWEWLTHPKWLNIDPKKLFITVWKEDKVSLEIWKKQKGIEEGKILSGDKKTNFWDMGDGPCGPNTEVYYDLFSKTDEWANKVEQLDDKRYIEICNIVFPEFYHKEDNYLPLENKCVDTGAGLERIAMILQEKKNTFEIDVWNPIIDLINQFSEEKDFEKNKGKYYIIANHFRTVIFALADGADIDSKGRGYILKKLIKKSCLLLFLLKVNSKNTNLIIDEIISINSFFYKNLQSNKKEIVDKLNEEISKNKRLIDKSFYELDNYKGEINGEIIFFWYDTKGIPMEIIMNFLESKKINFPTEEFNFFMKEQKNKGLIDRKNRKIKSFK